MARIDSGQAASPFNQCKRCLVEQAKLRIRADDVCLKCFQQYVTTKAVKRMETYRVRGSTKASKRLLLPLSFGPSSACLLHILDQHLRGQFERMNRAAYEIFVVHVDVFLDDQVHKESAEKLGEFKARFPMHAYSCLGLEDALLLDKINWSSLGVPLPPEAGSANNGTEILRQLLDSMPSATSKSDIAATLLTRLLVDVAERNNCEAILFGDSTTRLAERTLSETAKGRGFSLPWQVSDGMSPYGVGFNYPLRDLLKKELVTFSSLTANNLSDLIIYGKSASHISTSSKSTTIDDLMSQYFASVEENYPSIVANVVRTSSKLKSLPRDGHVFCGLCGLPLQAGEDGTSGWAGDQNSDMKRMTQKDHATCYGCSRSING